VSRPLSAEIRAELRKLAQRCWSRACAAAEDSTADADSDPADARWFGDAATALLEAVASTSTTPERARELVRQANRRLPGDEQAVIVLGMLRRAA
jgi:hypothetical protein